MKKAGVYEIIVDKAKKEVTLIIIGKWTDPDVAQFLKDYHNALLPLNTGEYTLLVDCKATKVISPDMIPPLEACMELYKSSCFKKNLFVLNENPIVQRQVERSYKKVGMVNTDIVIEK